MSTRRTRPPATEDVEAGSPGRELLRRFVQGELAELRVVLALALIWIVFHVPGDRFLTSSVNLTNLVLQIARRRPDLDRRSCSCCCSARSTSRSAP